MITDTIKRVKVYRITRDIEKYVEKIIESRHGVAYYKDFSCNFSKWLKTDLNNKFDIDINIEYIYDDKSPTDTFIISVQKTFGIKIEIKKGELYV